MFTMLTISAGRATLRDPYMSEPTLQELKELILAMDKKMDVQYQELDKKIDLQYQRLDQKMEVGFRDLHAQIDGVKAEIKQVETRLEGKIQQVETRLEGDLKRVEEKLTEKIDGLGKRLDFQEFISRGAILTLVGGVLTGFVKFLFFSNS